MKQTFRHSVYFCLKYLHSLHKFVNVYSISRCPFRFNSNIWFHSFWSFMIPRRRWLLVTSGLWMHISKHTAGRIPTVGGFNDEPRLRIFRRHQFPLKVWWSLGWDLHGPSVGQKSNSQQLTMKRVMIMMINIWLQCSEGSAFRFRLSHLVPISMLCLRGPHFRQLFPKVLLGQQKLRNSARVIKDEQRYAKCCCEVETCRNIVQQCSTYLWRQGMAQLELAHVGNESADGFASRCSDFFNPSSNTETRSAVFAFLRNVATLPDNRG